MRLGETYPDAKYVASGKPSYFEGEVHNTGPDNLCGCIFGNAIRNLRPEDDPEIQELKEFDQWIRQPSNKVKLGGYALDDLARKVKILPEPMTAAETDLRENMTEVQCYQDQGDTWGRIAQQLKKDIQTFLATRD